MAFNRRKAKVKKLITTTIVLACILVPMVALGGVAGSDHDLSAGAQELCFACHVPHNASGDKLWSSTPSGTFSGVADLCYTCHDGSITTIGQGTVFNATLEQHLTVGADCSADDGCHDVHNQNPNGTGRFLLVTETNNSYCETCHDATPYTGAGALGDHTAGITHFTSGTFTCNQCHTIHGATAQTTQIGALTAPILLDDNNTTYYGDFCVSCHNGTAPTAAAVGTGGVAATDVFDYSENVADGTETMHPTITVGGGTPVGGCNKCHDVHDPTGTAFGYILMEDNANSTYCVSCHGAAGAPAVGANTHFVGIPSDANMNNGLTPAMPWANQIDEDGTAGVDWATATANNMVCETCHSVHRQGNQGVDAEFFLRHENGNLNQICSSCHTAN